MDERGKLVNYENLLELVDDVLGDAGGPGEFKYDGGPKPYVKKSGDVSEKSKERVEQFNSGTLPSSEPQTIPVPTEEQYAQAQELVEKYYDQKDDIVDSLIPHDNLNEEQEGLDDAQLDWHDEQDKLEEKNYGHLSSSEKLEKQKKEFSGYLSSLSKNDPYGVYEDLKNDSQYFERVSFIPKKERNEVLNYQHDAGAYQDPILNGNIRDFDQEMIDRLSTAINSFEVKKDTQVLRTLTPDDRVKGSTEYLNSLLDASPGSIIHNKAFSSTTMHSIETSLPNYRGTPEETIDLLIDLKKGQKALPASQAYTYDRFATQREIILDKDSKFRIDHVDKEKRIVKLTLLDKSIATDSLAIDYTFIPEEHPRQKDPDWGGKPQEGGTGSNEPAASPATILVPTQEQRGQAQELVEKYYESNLKERMQEILQEKTGQLANYYSEIEKIYSEGKLSEEGYKNILSGKEKDYGYSTSEERIKYQAEQELKEEEERTPEQKEKLIKSQQKSLVSERKELQENDDRGGAEHLSKDAKFWKQNEPLTKFQKSTIRGYQFQSGHVQDYSINGPDPNESDYVNNRNKKLSDTMSKIAQSFEASKDVTVHRVLTHDEETKGSKEYVESLLNAEPGTEVHNKAFSSTTMYKGADKYRGTPEQSLDLEISIKKGQKGAIPVNSTYIGDYWDEREIILDKNSRLRVDSVDKEKRIVKLSLMDKEEKQEKSAIDSISIRSDLYYVIETPKGHLRIGHGWQNRSPADYGYIVGYTGADGDEMDCYLGPNRWSNVVYVIDQNQIGSTLFDEHKVMIGYASEKQALNDYYAGHNLGKQIFRGITVMSKARFINWLKTGNLKKSLT